RQSGCKRAVLIQVLQERVDRIAGRRLGNLDLEPGAAERLDDLRQVPREQWRGDAEGEEHDRDDGQASRTPLLQELLAQQDREPGHAADSRSRPTRRRKTSSSVGRCRSKEPIATSNAASAARSGRLAAAALATETRTTPCRT